MGPTFGTTSLKCMRSDIVIRANEEAPERWNSGPIQGMLGHEMEGQDEATWQGSWGGQQVQGDSNEQNNITATTVLKSLTDSYMSGTCRDTFYVWTYIIFQQPYKVGIIITLIIKMKKMRKVGLIMAKDLEVGVWSPDLDQKGSPRRPASQPPPHHPFSCWQLQAVSSISHHLYLSIKYASSILVIHEPST